MKINNKLSSTRNLFIIYAIILTSSLLLLSILYYLFGNEILETNYAPKEIVFFTFSSWIALLLIFPFFIYGWKKVIPLLSKPFLHNTKTLPEINKKIIHLLMIYLNNTVNIIQKNYYVYLLSAHLLVLIN